MPYLSSARADEKYNGEERDLYSSNKIESNSVGWFVKRDLMSARLASSLDNGSIVSLGGWIYQVEETATGSASATADLGVDGLIPFGVIHPQQLSSTCLLYTSPSPRDS